MNQQERFCRQCGQPLEEGAMFCTGCGSQTGNVHRSSQAAARAPYPLPPAQPAQTAALKEKKSIAPKLILIAVGLLLLLFAVRAPAALLFGKSAVARVESVDRVYNRSRDSLEYNYQVTYVYDDGDKQRRSNYDMPRTYNVANLPSVGSLIKVKYIPGINFLSYPVGIKNTGLGSLVTGIIGVGLIFLAIKGNVRRVK